MSLVLWSGGLDSTLILHNLAVEQRDGTKAHAHGVRALSINQSQIGCHPPTVEASRKAIKESFRNKGIIVHYVEVTIQQTVDAWRLENFVGGGENPQLLLWLSLAVNYLETDEDLYAGYIRGDDAWHRVGSVNEAFSALQRLGGKTGALQFPLEWESKAGVIRAMKNLGLYENCWWCEECKPKTKRGLGLPCGKCKSCITNDTALWQLRKYREKS